MAENLAQNESECSHITSVSAEVKPDAHAVCDSKSTCKAENVPSSESMLSQSITKVIPTIDEQYKTLNSLVGKIQSFNKASEKLDTAANEIADTLTAWNMDFIELHESEHVTLSNRIASSSGVLSSFITLADILLPKLEQRPQWIRCFVELSRCFAIWSSTTPLMQKKLFEGGIVSGCMYILEVCKKNPVSEPLMFLTQLILDILHDCLQVPSSIPHYMKSHCDQIVECFTNSTDSDIRVTSLVILSYLASKLSAKQCQHLRFVSQDAKFLLDVLSKSLTEATTFSSPISLLKDLQCIITAEPGNGEPLILQGMLSIVFNSLASTNSNVQREAVILLWKLASLPHFVEKIKSHADLIHTVKNLQGSVDPNLAIASKCMLWDITGEDHSDIDSVCFEFAEGCYICGMYEKCVTVCTRILNAAINDIDVNKVRLLKGKSLFFIFNQAFVELPAEVSPKDYSTRQKLSACTEQAVEVVCLLGSVHDEGCIDEEGSKYLDLSMLHLISSQNALKRCDRCLLCLQNLKNIKDDKRQHNDTESTPQTNKRSKELQHSHVWPKAIYEAFSSGLPKNSSKRLFRLSGTILTQPKSPKEIAWFILCKGCEQLIGSIEEQFISKFFKAIYDTTSPSKPLQAQKITYGTWLYQFCISIFLRGIAVLPRTNENFSRVNADKLYELFTLCRKVLKPTDAKQSFTALPPVHLFVNSPSPKAEETQNFSTIHEALVSPAFLALTDRTSPNVYFNPPTEACLFVAHTGILNIVIDIGSVILSHSHFIHLEGGEYHVPSESERNQSIPLEVKKAFYAVAHQIEVQETLMSDKLRESPWSKNLDQPPQKRCEETYMIHQATENDQKVLHQQGVKPSQDPTYAKNMNFLPRGFELRRSKANSGTIELPPGHRILLHCEIRDTDSSYDKGTTVFLAIGDGSEKYPSDKPYAIYHQYDPGIYINVGMFISPNDLNVTGVLSDDEPKRYARTMCENPNWQENMQCTLMELLYLTGFSSFRSYLSQAEDKRLHMKCLTSRRCWYCEDRCENCMESAAVGLNEKTEGVLLKFCSKKCRSSFKANPKILNLVPATFQIRIHDGKVTVLPPPRHIPFQRIVDTLYEHELGLNATRAVYMCFGDGSAEFPRDRVYIIYHHTTAVRQTLAACFVSDDLSLTPISVAPKNSDIQVVNAYVDFLHSNKVIESMLLAVLSDANFTTFLSWRLYNLFALGIAYFP